MSDTKVVLTPETVRRWAPSYGGVDRERMDNIADAWETDRAAFASEIARREAATAQIAKAYWGGHTDGRLWGRKAITPLEIHHGGHRIDALRGRRRPRRHGEADMALDELQALADAAPDGPWEAHDGGETVCQMNPNGTCNILLDTEHGRDALPLADFIAACRTEVPKLIDFARNADMRRMELEEEVAALRARLADYPAGHQPRLPGMV